MNRVGNYTVNTRELTSLISRYSKLSTLLVTMVDNYTPGNYNRVGPVYARESNIFRTGGASLIVPNYSRGSGTEGGVYGPYDLKQSISPPTSTCGFIRLTYEIPYLKGIRINGVEYRSTLDKCAVSNGGRWLPSGSGITKEMEELFRVGISQRSSPFSPTAKSSGSGYSSYEFGPGRGVNAAGGYAVGYDSCVSDKYYAWVQPHGAEYRPYSTVEDIKEDVKKYLSDTTAIAEGAYSKFDDFTAEDAIPEFTFDGTRWHFNMGKRVGGWSTFYTDVDIDNTLIPAEIDTQFNNYLVFADCVCAWATAFVRKSSSSIGELLGDVKVGYFSAKMKSVKMIAVGASGVWKIPIGSIRQMSGISEPWDSSWGDITTRLPTFPLSYTSSYFSGAWLGSESVTRRVSIKVALFKAEYNPAQLFSNENNMPQSFTKQATVSFTAYPEGDAGGTTPEAIYMFFDEPGLYAMAITANDDSSVEKGKIEFESGAMEGDKLRYAGQYIKGQTCGAYGVLFNYYEMTPMVGMTKDDVKEVQ